MTDDFTPPIKERATKELLEIVGASYKWNSKAVLLANNELINRNINSEKIKTAKYLEKKKDRIQNSNKENASYHIFDFIFDPIPNLIEIIFSWELKKDGFPRKAEQQKKLRMVIGVIILISIIFLYLI